MEKKIPMVRLIKDPNTLNVSNGKEWAIVPEYKLILDYGTDNDEILDYNKNIIEEVKGVSNIQYNDNAEVVLRKYSHGLVYYGYTEWNGKKAENGSLYRTNPDIIYDALKLNVFEVIIEKYNSAWMSMMVSDVMNLLPEAYSIVLIPEKFDYFNTRGWHIVSNEDKFEIERIMAM